VALLCWFVLRSLIVRMRSSGGMDERLSGLVLIARGTQAGIVGFALAALFGDFQYIEMLYAQIMLIGAIAGIVPHGLEVSDARTALPTRSSPIGDQKSADLERA
jgi:hypothetical protein